MRTRNGQKVMILNTTDLNTWYDGKRKLVKVSIETCIKYKSGTNDDYRDTLRPVGREYREWTLWVYERGFGWCQVGVTRKESKAYMMAGRKARAVAA